MKDSNPIEQDWTEATLDDAREYLTDIINSLPYGDETQRRLMLVRDALTNVGAAVASLVNTDAEFMYRQPGVTAEQERERTQRLVEQYVGRRWVDDPERPGKGKMVPVDRRPNA
jgi:hypothetical protein